MWNALVDYFFLRGGAGLCVAGLCIGCWVLRRGRPPKLGAVVQAFLAGQGVMVGLSLVRAGLASAGSDAIALGEFRTYLTLAGMVVEWVSLKSIVGLCRPAAEKDG